MRKLLLQKRLLKPATGHYEKEKIIQEGKIEEGNERKESISV